MTHPDSTGVERDFEPRWPTLSALGLLIVWVFLLSLPMWTGAFLADTPWSDQYATGYAFRAWVAEQWKALGHIPQWNPMIMGGLPLAAGHGDAFYPTAWLRLVLPTALAMNLGFVVHYVLAGLFTYLLLRLLKVSWTGSVVGGLAYQLSGVVVSLVSPGHDGKLFVSALLPLALIALVLAIRRRRFEGYALGALTVGLALLSPHYQMVYYMLIFAGVFACYLTFGEPDDRTARDRATGLGLALAALVVGFGIAMIQVLPFYHYLPLSPRALGYGGFEASASYAIPWEHVPEFFLAGFAGDRQVYWGSNFIKLHSEYLGLPVIALAVLGALGGRRRLVYWLGGVGLVILLVSLGSATPFYRLWWSIMPFIKQTRAPGMAFFAVAFVVAVFAALGTERLERHEGKRHANVWLALGGVVVLLALIGVVGGFAKALAVGIQGPQGMPVQQVETAQASIRLGAVLSGVALMGLGALAYLARRRSIPAAVFCISLPIVIGADLWRNATPFWAFSRVHEELFVPDPATERIAATPLPYRVLDIPQSGVYDGSALMAFGIPQLLGHHGNELHNFDELMGGKNQWTNVVGSTKLWDLMAVRYLLLPADPRLPDSLPGFTRVLARAEASSGLAMNLFERAAPPEYAWLVPASVKASNDQAIPILLDPQVAFDRIVFLDPDAPVNPAPVTVLPEPIDATAEFEVWEPGRMVIRLSPPAPQDAYLVVSENWYPDWTAFVNGGPAPVIRGDGSLITVPVPQGAENVVLLFDSADYRRGRAITLISLGILAVGFVAPLVLRTRKRG